jgi:hypothetical protein
MGDTDLPHALVPAVGRRRRRRLNRLVADARRLARLLGLGVRTIRTTDAGGKLPRPIRLGSRVVWVLGGQWGIRAWLAAGAPSRTEWEGRRGQAATCTTTCRDGRRR